MPEAAPPATRPQIILAFDFGLRRLGLATGDTLTRAARALRTLPCIAGVPVWEELLREVRDVGAQQLVVGCPYNVDDSASVVTTMARKFAAELQRRSGLPVHLVDERYSSIEAQQQLRGMRAAGQRHHKVHKSDIDAMAAAVVLERWLAGEGSR